MSYVGKIKDPNETTHLVGSTLYGTCATAAGTAAKVVTCTDFDKLITGVTIHVKFTNSNSAANSTLNVNSTGAKNIIAGTSVTPGSGSDESWASGAVVSFTYDGTSWVMNDYIANSRTINATDTSSKIFLLGTASQAASVTPYTHDTAYVGTDGCLYSGGNKVLTSAPVTSVAGKTGAVTLTASDVGALASTTKYAGAASAGGAATSAAKLTNTSKIGDTNKPVYFTASGVPAAISYTIDKSVPSTAIFTDANVTQIELAEGDENSYELLLANPGTATQTTGTLKSQWLTYKPLDYELVVGDESNDLYTKIAYHGVTVQTAANSYLQISSTDIRNSTTWDGTHENLKDTLATKLPLSGGSVTGSIVANGSGIYLGSSSGRFAGIYTDDINCSGWIGGNIIRCGTKLVQASAVNYLRVFTNSELNTLFGTTGCSNSNCVVFAMNGDYSAQGKYMTGTVYENGNWYIRTSDGTNLAVGSFRVNYICIKFT